MNGHARTLPAGPHAAAAAQAAPAPEAAGVARLGRARLRLLGIILAAHREGRRLSYGELCRRLGRSRNAVHGVLLGLRRAGLVDWEPGRARTLRPCCTFIPAADLGE